MSSLRTEIEQAVGLKFPERNGEALIRFEESMEIPRVAETLMRGFYRDPEKVKSSFQSLLQETGNLLDILLPRRSRLREWAEELPERPSEAESFLRESADQLITREQRMLQAEKELMHNLQENRLDDLFPIPLAAFGVCSFREASVKIYLRPIGQLAEILELNPEQLRMAVRIHFLILLLLLTGLDLDGKTCVRSGDEPVVQALVGSFALKFLKNRSPELEGCYNEWVKAWGGTNPPHNYLVEQGTEKVRAAMVFWRRQLKMSWDEYWRIAGEFEKLGFSDIGTFPDFKKL